MPGAAYFIPPPPPLSSSHALFPPTLQPRKRRRPGRLHPHGYPTAALDSPLPYHPWYHRRAHDVRFLRCAGPGAHPHSRRASLLHRSRVCPSIPAASGRYLCHLHRHHPLLIRGIAANLAKRTQICFLAALATLLPGLLCILWNGVLYMAAPLFCVLLLWVLAALLPAIFHLFAKS